MSTASAEARAQCATQLRILHRPGRSLRTQRNPGDQDGCRVAQRADVLLPTASERSENSRGDPVCSRSCSRASIGRIRRRTGSGRAASRRRQDLFGSTTIDCCACMEEANTHGTAETTGVVIKRTSRSTSKSKRKRPDNRGAPKLQAVRPSGSQLGRLDLQDPAGARNRDRPRLHRLWDLAHQVDVEEPVL